MKKILFLVFVMLMTMLAGISQVWANEYYRGDKRSPEEVKARGGFFPQTYSGGAPSVPLSMSLYQHVEFPDLNSGYISTSSSERVAGLYGAGGWLYTVRGDGNLVNAAFVLRQFYQRPSEQEFAAIGGIPWRQIVGWERVNSRGTPVGDFVDNPDYAGDDAFTGEPNPNPAEIVPLAGFPVQHPAWHMAPWNQYPFTGCGGFGSSRSLRASGDDPDIGSIGSLGSTSHGSIESLKPSIGPGGVGSLSSSDDDQCEASERAYEWYFLSLYRTKSGADKQVIFKKTLKSEGLIFPSELATWVDMNGSGKLSLCGLFYDSEGSNTKITCSKNNGDNTFSSFITSLSDVGWSAGRAFTIQNGKVAYCRVVDIVWNRLQCATSTGSSFFNTEKESGIVDAGYNDTRGWRSVYRDGTTAFCSITGEELKGFRIDCSKINGIKTRVTLFDTGWDDSRMWLDIAGKGVGHESFCRLIGLAGHIHLRCRVRQDDSTWSNEITSGDNRDGGYSGLRFPVRMNGAAQEYCAVTGYYYDGLTCTKLNANNTLSDYWTALPRRVNPSNQTMVTFADVDGDKLEDLCFLDRGGQAVYCYLNKGGAFKTKFVTLNLTGTPLNSFASQITTILPVEYTEAGPRTSVCYNTGGGSYRCDQFLVY